MVPRDPGAEAPWFLYRRAWTRALHRRPHHAILGSIFLAIISAVLAGTSAFSFAVWHVLYAGYLIAPSMQVAQRLRRGEFADLLMTRLANKDFVSAHRSAFYLATAWATIPYVLYWTIVIAFHKPIFRSDYHDVCVDGVGPAIAGAVANWCAMTAYLWYVQSSMARLLSPLGIIRRLLALTVLVVLLPGYLTVNRLTSTERWPSSLGVWLFAAGFCLAAYAVQKVGAHWLLESIRRDNERQT